MTFATAEVRWFFSGEVPGDVWEWFRGGDLWAPEPERVDSYLILPGCSTTGIKMREGRFEVKTRTTTPTLAQYGPDVRGYGEKWLKWSRVFADSEIAQAVLMGGDERWLGVHKARTIRGFSLDGVDPGDDPLEVDVMTNRPIRGCGAEITQVELRPDRGVKWWTIGLEGYGDDDDAPVECLERGASFLFGATPPPLLLDLEDSISYAGWLATAVEAGPSAPTR